MILYVSQIVVGIRWGLLASLLLMPSLFGQTVDSSTSDSSFSVSISADTASDIQAPATLTQMFRQEQLVLNQQVDALINQGATPQQLDTWREQNADYFQAQLQLAMLIAAYSDFQPMDYITEVAIPEGASQELGDLLMTRANLSNSFAQIHNQLRQQYGQVPTVQSARTLESSAAANFEQQNAGVLQAQSMRAVIVAEQVAHQPLPDLPPLVIPMNASPELKTFLTIRDQIERAETLLHNQYCGGDRATLNAALDQWDQQHQSLFIQMSQAAQSLAKINAAQPPPQEEEESQ